MQVTAKPEVTDVPRAENLLKAVAAEIRSGNAIDIRQREKAGTNVFLTNLRNRMCTKQVVRLKERWKAARVYRLRPQLPARAAGRPRRRSSSLAPVPFEFGPPRVQR